MFMLLLLQAGSPFPTSGLARDLSTFGIGLISGAVAVTSLAVFALRKSKNDRTLLWFGIFAAIYGLRLLLTSQIFRASFGVSTETATVITLLITYIIQLPALMFALDLIDALGAKLAKVMFAVAGALAITGVVSISLGIGRGVVPQVNNVLVVFFFLPTYIWAYSHSERSKGMRWMQASFFVFVASVFYDNLSGFVLKRPFSLEPFGFLILLIAMSYVTVQKTIASEQKLHAVERELEIARTIQQSILPESIPQTKGLDVAVRYVPMTQVAGDFYDFIELEDGRLGVLVADVSGHGVPAALIASMLKMAFVSQMSSASDPALMLSKLNGALCGHFSSHFVTAVYAVIDSTAGTMIYSAAAHPPLLLRRGNGIVEELAENGLMLGAFEFAQYANASTTIGSGDQVLLYTDGLSEGSNRGDEEFGIQRLKECFDLGAAKSLDQLFAKARDWTIGVPQQDDLTAVVISRH